jgi:hypothetical protein
MREDFARDMHCIMPSKTEPFTQREGVWEELIRDVARFAGKRVRVTVLPDRPPSDAALNLSVRQWLAEGDALEVTPQASTSDAFTQLLVEKARKQGLMI